LIAAAASREWLSADAIGGGRDPRRGAAFQIERDRIAGAADALRAVVRRGRFEAL
jgi:hypothetical protein